MTARLSLLLGGGLGLIVGLLTLVYPPAVPETVWGHPFDPGVHVAVAVVLVVCHLLKAHGFAFGLARLEGGLTMWSMRAAAVGFVIVAICEAISATLVGVPMEDPAAVRLNDGYGAGSMLLAVSSVVGGIGIGRRALLPGAARWSVLLSGLFMILVVTPALIMGRGPAAYLALAVWSAMFLWIGSALEPGGE